MYLRDATYVNMAPCVRAVAPPVGVSANEQQQSRIAGDEFHAMPTSSTYSRSEQTVRGDAGSDGRTQRHIVEERETKTVGGGSGGDAWGTGSLTRMTRSQRTEMTSSYSRGADQHPGWSL